MLFLGTDAVNLKKSAISLCPGDSPPRRSAWLAFSIIAIFDFTILLFLWIVLVQVREAKASAYVYSTFAYAKLYPCILAKCSKTSHMKSTLSQHPTCRLLYHLTFGPPHST